MTTNERIKIECQKLSDMLCAKNDAYGDAAVNPVGIFSSGTPGDLICVRIDDKLNRIKNNPEAFGEDVTLDLLGYLILLRIVRNPE